MMSGWAVLGCSGVQGGEHPAAHAFDGDPHTFWMAERPGGAPGQWLAFDLGAERRVCGVEIMSGGSDEARHVANFQLEYSLAQPAGAACDANWQEAARRECRGAQSRTPFDGVAARYWRVLLVSAKQVGQPAAIARIALRIAREEAPLLMRQGSIQADEDDDL